MGETIIGILRTPDLTVPALIKEDTNVDFHSVYSQYLYEYLFRMKNLYAGKRPAATFTFLSEKEMYIQKGLINLDGINSNEKYDALAQDIRINNESKEFFSLRWYCSGQKFNTYSDSSTYASTQFTTQLNEILKTKELKSDLCTLLTAIYDTVTLHCKLSYEAISEIEDEFGFLQEYDKRWNGFVASMIKIDEILTPLSMTVSKVYKRIFSDYSCHPQFSFLRFFIFIWRKEVFNMCKDSIEDYIIQILRKFHNNCLNYSKEEKSVRKAQKQNRASLSDYFSSSMRNSEEGNGFNSMMNPMISRFNIKKEETKNSF